MYTMNTEFHNALIGNGLKRKVLVFFILPNDLFPSRYPYANGIYIFFFLGGGVGVQKEGGACIGL